MLAELVAGAIGRQQKAADAPIGRSIIAMVARRREIASAIAAGADDIGDALPDEAAALAREIAGTPSRADADLIAKTGHADDMVKRRIDTTGGDDLYPLLLGLFADIERIVGGAPPVPAGGRR